MRTLPKCSLVAVLLMAAALSLGKLTAATGHQDEEARGILMEAAAAMGGLEAVESLRSQVVVSRGSSYEPEQALRPDGEARHVADFEYTLTRDIAGEKLRIEWKRESFYPFSRTWQFTEVIDSVVGWVEGQDGYRSQPRQHVMSTARIATRWREERRSAPHILLTALHAPGTLRRLPDEQAEGRAYRVLSFEDRGGQPVRLWIDAATHLPARVDLLEDDPIYGDTHNDLLFSDWREVSGIKLPFSLVYRVNGRVVQTEQHREVRNNVQPAEDAFDIPNEVRAQSKGDWGRPSQWILRRIAMGAHLDVDQAPPATFTELARGVYHVAGGTHHSLVVEMEDHLVVVEAPLNEERSRAVIAGIKERWPARPIRSVVNTHFHNDHSGGLRTYVAEGARVLTGAVNQAHLRRVFSAPHTLVPDALEGRRRPAEIEAIAEPKILTDGQRRVEVYPVECSHVEGMLMVYLPQEKVLFQSDLFVAGSPLPLQAGARELLRAIQRHHLQVERLAGGHGPVGSFEELRKAAGEAM